MRPARPGRAIVDEGPPAGVATIHGMTRVIVDNSTGADAPFAAEITRELQRRGFETELRGPSPQARYDTAIRVTDGVAVRLPEAPDRETLERVADAVRLSEQHRTVTRRRYRPVPILQGESRRALTWVDALS